MPERLDMRLEKLSRFPEDTWIPPLMNVCFRINGTCPQGFWPRQDRPYAVIDILVCNKGDEVFLHALASPENAARKERSQIRLSSPLPEFGVFRAPYHIGSAIGVLGKTEDLIRFGNAQHNG